MCHLQHAHNKLMFNCGPTHLPASDGSVHAMEGQLQLLRRPVYVSGDNLASNRLLATVAGQ